MVIIARATVTTTTTARRVTHTPSTCSKCGTRTITPKPHDGRRARSQCHFRLFILRPLYSRLLVSLAHHTSHLTPHDVSRLSVSPRASPPSALVGSRFQGIYDTKVYRNYTTQTIRSHANTYGSSGTPLFMWVAQHGMHATRDSDPEPPSDMLTSANKEYLTELLDEYYSSDGFVFDKMRKVSPVLCCVCPRERMLSLLVRSSFKLVRLPWLSPCLSISLCAAYPLTFVFLCRSRLWPPDLDPAPAPVSRLPRQCSWPWTTA